MFRVVSSAPYSAPVDRLGLVEWTRSKVCKHDVEYRELSSGGLPGGHVTRYRERCTKCHLERIVQEGTGRQGALYVSYCERLGLNPELDAAAYCEHDFWLTWVKAGRLAAVTEALTQGHALAPNH